MLPQLSPNAHCLMQALGVYVHRCLMRLLMLHWRAEPVNKSSEQSIEIRMFSKAFRKGIDVSHELY